MVTPCQSHKLQAHGLRFIITHIVQHDNDNYEQYKCSHLQVYGSLFAVVVESLFVVIEATSVQQVRADHHTCPTL